MNTSIVLTELSFKAIRSGGAGGQHVNKVSSKIELTFDLPNSHGLSDEQKELLYKKLATKLTNDKVLILFCGETRSQHKNKAIAIQRFLSIIEQGLKIPKKRKATKPSRASIRKRIKAKKKQSAKKKQRKNPDIEN